jgi:hypothetical protein
MKLIFWKPASRELCTVCKKLDLYNYKISSSLQVYVFIAYVLKDLNKMNL